MRKIINLFGVIAFIMLISCSKSLPNIDDAEKIIKKKIQLNSESKVKLIDVKKTNGTKMKIKGMDFYNFIFEGTISFDEEGYSAVKEALSPTRGFLFIRKEKPPTWISNSYFEKIEKGEKGKITGELYFVNTENGWEEAKIRIRLLERK